VFSTFQTMYCVGFQRLLVNIVVFTESDQCSGQGQSWHHKPTRGSTKKHQIWFSEKFVRRNFEKQSAKINRV